jgi:hypothetical protein
MTTVSRRLFRRSTGSWPIWVGMVLLFATMASVWRIRHKPPHKTEIVLRLAEGVLSPMGEPISTGVIRAHITDLAFSRTHLEEVVKRHPLTFRTSDQDLVKAVDDLRSAMDIDISENDFLEYRSDVDPPRSVRIVLGFQAQNPEESWTIAHDLADLLSRAEVERQRQQLDRDVAVNARAESHGADAWAVSPRRPNAPVKGVPNPVADRLRAATQQAIAARLAVRSLDEQQALRFEIVDGGSPPVQHSRVLAGLLPILAVLPVLLLAAGLLWGAFDPRVTDETDLGEIGAPVLGHLSRRV